MNLAKTLGIPRSPHGSCCIGIRLAVQSKSFVKLGGPDSVPVEADETFIGGKARNIHKSKRARLSCNSGGLQGGSGKAVVMGMVQRCGQVRGLLGVDGGLGSWSLKQ